MVDWLTWSLVGVSVVLALLGVVSSVMRKRPNDLHLLAALLILALFIVQIVVGLLAPGMGNSPTGILVEWWAYLITALVVLIAGTFWALLDKSNFGSLVFLIIGFTLAVMVYRMNQIWFVQIA